MEAISLAGAYVATIQGALGSGSAVREPLPADAAEIGAFVAALLAQTMQPAAAAPTPVAETALATAADSSVAVATGSVLPDPRQLLAVRQASTANPALGTAEPELQQPDESRRLPEAWRPLAANVAATVAPALQDDGLEAALSRSLPGFDGDLRAAARPPVPGEALIVAGDVQAAATQAASGDVESPLVQTLQRLGEAGAVQQTYSEKASPLPVRDPALFAERLNQQVAVMITQHAQQARLAVNPPELGPVEVRVTVVGDEATIQLAATHAATREALEEALPRLRAAFADSGIALGHAGVFTEMPERHPDPRQAAGSPANHADLGAALGTNEPPPLARVLLGLVDAFV